MRVLVTGAAGFLGSHLAEALLKYGHTVIGLDDYSTGEAVNVPVGCIMQDVDLTTRPYPEFFAGVEVVYHCAAAAYEGVSVFSPGFVSKNIYAGSANVFSACAAAHVRRVVFCSSMARYGIGKPPFRETDPPTPVDPYGFAKLGAENLLRMLAEIHGFEWCVVVPHNIYGPKQRYNDPYRNVAAIMANRLLRGQPPIIYGDGEQVRCFSYVDDVIPALMAAGFTAASKYQIINVGPELGEVTINELAGLLMEVTGFVCNPIHMTDRPREVKVASCSAQKAQQLLGLHFDTPLITGLTKLVEHIKERGPKEFDYHLNLEIENQRTPQTWTKKLI